MWGSERRSDLFMVPRELGGWVVGCWVRKRLLDSWFCFLPGTSYMLAADVNTNDSQVGFSGISFPFLSFLLPSLPPFM